MFLVQAIRPELEEVGEDYVSNYHEKSRGHPEDELRSRQEIEQLGKSVRRLRDRAKHCNQGSARAGEDGPDERVARKGFLEEKGGKGSVEDQSGLWLLVRIPVGPSTYRLEG